MSLNSEFPRAGNILYSSIEHLTGLLDFSKFQFPSFLALLQHLSFHLKLKGCTASLFTVEVPTLSRNLFSPRASSFALPKHISFSKWVVQVQFRNDFSIATSPGNCSLFGIFDSNTFHTYHTPGLCCSGLRFQACLYSKTYRLKTFPMSCSICCSKSVQSRLPQIST